EQLNSIKELINNSQTDKKIQISSFSVKDIGYSEEILSYNPNLYTNLFEEHFLPRKIKIFRFLNLKYIPWEISCFLGYDNRFYNISITFENLNLNKFKATDFNLRKYIRTVIIKESKIYSEFLADIFSLNRIIKLEIDRSDIIIEKNIKFRNDSIKKLMCNAQNNENCQYFYELINSLINLQEIFFNFQRKTDFDFFASSDLTIRQLNLKTIFFHKNFIEQYEFMLLSNLIPSEKVSLWGKCDPEYDIKQLYIDNIVISILDLKLISNLKKLKYLKFYYCDFPTNGILNINISLLMDLNVFICYKKNQKISEFIRNITETSVAKKSTLKCLDMW
ncbi:hypothetical protein CWI39_1457p0010, partial [Hamiltosporidium magnivora]